MNALTESELELASGPARAVSEAESEYPPLVVAASTLAVLQLLGIVALLDRQIISLMIGGIKADLHVTDMQVSLLQGLAFAFFYALCGLPLGHAVDRISRRLVIFGGVTVWSLATMAGGFAHNYEQLLLSRMFVGAGEAALAPAAYSIIADLFHRRRLGRALAVYATGSSFGVALSTALGGLALATSASLTRTIPALSHFSPWQLALVAIGAPGIFCALLIFLVPEPKRRAVRGSAQGSWRELGLFMKRHWQFFACHFAGFSCLLLLAYAIMGWAPSVLMRVYHWDVAKVGLWMAPTLLIAGLTSLGTSGTVVDLLFGRGVKDAHLRYFAFGSLAVIAGGGLMFVAHQPFLFIACIVVTMVAVNMSAVSAAALQVVTPAQFRGRISAIYLMVMGLVSQSLGPVVVAFFTDVVFKDEAKIQVSLGAAFVCIAPLALIFLALGMKPMRAAVLDMESASAG